METIKVKEYLHQQQNKENAGVNSSKELRSQVKLINSMNPWEQQQSRSEF